MADKVSIFYTSDGKEWGSYLQQKLGCKNVHINTELVNLSDENIEFDSKVNVFLVSPSFLELQSWNVLKNFDRRTAVAVLTGVDHNDWSETAAKYNAHSVLEWLEYELEASDQSVRDLLVIVIGIYELTEEIGDKDSTHWEDYINVPATQDNLGEGSPYKLLPSRPSRAVNAVTNVFRKDEDVFLLLETMPDGNLEVVFHEDGRAINPAFEGNFGLYSFPWTETRQVTFDVALNGKEIGYGQIDAIKQKENTNRESIYDLPPPRRHGTFSSALSTSPKSVSYYNEDNSYYDYPPPRRHKTSTSHSPTSVCSSVTSSIISSNSDMSQMGFKDSFTAGDRSSTSSQPSKLEQIRLLLEDETDPLNVLCGCLNVPKDSKSLDEKLTSMIKTTENLKHVCFPQISNKNIDKSDVQWPTLVHFGAEFNLFSFCDSLLSSPIMYNTCRTKNCDGLLPHEVARKAGNEKLAHALEAFASCVTQGQLGAHDSGFYQSLRLSNAVSFHEDTVPTPHRWSGESQYKGATGQQKKEQFSKSGKSSTDPNLSLQLPVVPVEQPGSSVNADGDKTPTACLSEIFQGTVFSRNSTFDGHGMFQLDSPDEKSDSSLSTDSKDTVKDDDESIKEGIVPVHARVSRTPSDSEVGKTKDQRKSGSLLGKFFKRKTKQRSYSETSLNTEEEAVRRNPKAKIYRKLPEKTDSGISGNSTYSESSFGRASDLKKEYEEAHKDVKTSKKKTKDRWKLLLHTAQRRNSIRIDHILQDGDISAPAPLPGKSPDEIF